MNEVDRIELVKDLDFSPTMVALVMAYVFFLDLLINLDHGAVPAALVDISQDLKMDQTDMGVMGSMVFFGTFVGSISASFITAYSLTARSIPDIILHTFTTFSDGPTLRPSEDPTNL